MTLKEPIVEGAYYEREDGVFMAHAFGAVFCIGKGMYFPDGKAFYGCQALTRRVYLVPVDPAEVVAELRRMLYEGYADSEAADLVAAKLGVK